MTIWIEQLLISVVHHSCYSKRALYVRLPSPVARPNVALVVGFYHLGWAAVLWAVPSSGNRRLRLRRCSLAVRPRLIRRVVVRVAFTFIVLVVIWIVLPILAVLCPFAVPVLPIVLVSHLVVL